MATLELNIRQRIFLDALIGQQRGSVSDIEVFFDIRNKLKIENREQYLRALPSGEVIIDAAAINKAGSEKIEMEKEERKKLHELITTHKQFSPSDLDWVLPIKKQLELAL